MNRTPRVVVIVQARMGSTRLPGKVFHSAARDATEPADREHVTRFIWRQPHLSCLGSITDGDDNSHIRWTVDAQQDLDIVRTVFGDLMPDDEAFGYRPVLLHAAHHPKVHVKSQHMVQKPT